MNYAVFLFCKFNFLMSRVYKPMVVTFGTTLMVPLPHLKGSTVIDSYYY